jgi:hypothetical protein
MPPTEITEGRFGQGDPSSSCVKVEYKINQST